MTDRNVVIGNPIAKTKSIALHAAFAQQCDQDMGYEAALGSLCGFAHAEAFRVWRGVRPEVGPVIETFRSA